MKTSLTLTVAGVALVAGVFTSTFSAPAFAEDAPAEKAQVLLDKVKKSQLDRQLAEKQTTIDRLHEDLDHNKKDAESLQQTIDATANLINDSTKHYEELSAERRRLQHDLNLTIARIDAETQRLDGLRNLSTAQGKSLSALNRHIEEIDVRSQLHTAEMKAMADGKLQAGEEIDDKKHPDLMKLRKELYTSEAKTESEEKAARIAMKAAASKVQAADMAAARVQKLSAEVASEETGSGAKPVTAKAVPKSSNSLAPIGEKLPPKTLAKPSATPTKH